jgi:hypothetical protein
MKLHHAVLARGGVRHARERHTGHQAAGDRGPGAEQ